MEPRHLRQSFPAPDWNDRISLLSKRHNAAGDTSSFAQTDRTLRCLQRGERVYKDHGEEGMDAVLARWALHYGD